MAVVSLVNVRPFPLLPMLPLLLRLKGTHLETIPGWRRPSLFEPGGKPGPEGPACIEIKNHKIKLDFRPLSTMTTTTATG